MNASVDSVFPEKYRILSGSALKMIAVITMLIDHIGAVLLSMYQPAQKILFTLFGREYTVISVNDLSHKPEVFLNLICGMT